MNVKQIMVDVIIKRIVKILQEILLVFVLMDISEMGYFVKVIITILTIMIILVKKKKKKRYQ